MIIGRSAIELRNPLEDTNARIGDGNHCCQAERGRRGSDALRETRSNCIWI